METFFGFAISDSMFDTDVKITRRIISIDVAKDKIKIAIPCFNPSHKATIAAMNEKFNIHIKIPKNPPIVKLIPGDSIIIMSVRGLPRLTDNHEYTQDQINSATFTFAEWVIK